MLNFGSGEDDENHNNNEKKQQNPQRPADEQKRLQRLLMMKRQDSWSGFKDKAYRVASTVVLPRNRRATTREDEGTGSLRTKCVSISVRSLPQMKRFEEATTKARRGNFKRSISAPQRPLVTTPTEECEKMLTMQMPSVASSTTSMNSNIVSMEDETTVLSKKLLQASPVGQSRRIVFNPRTSRILEEGEEDEENEEPKPTDINTNNMMQKSSDENLRIASRNLQDELLPCIATSRKRSVPNTLRFAEPAATSFQASSSSPPKPVFYLPSPTEESLPPLQERTSITALSFTGTGSIFSENDQLQKFSGETFTEMEEEGVEYVLDEEESLTYEDYYNCMPPPIFMFIITIVEVGFFIYHSKRLLNDPKHGHIGKYSPAPLDSWLIYNPTRRYEVWRYITYAFIHSGYMHLINNIVIQLVLGILLEIVHKWGRVLCIYFAGILAGSLATSITEPYNYLAGASAGVYALIAAHLSTVILNWSHMERPWIRVLVFVAFLIHDGGTAIYFAYIVGEKTNVGYSAHLGGAVAGLLVGIHVLKNIHWSEWEIILWYTSIVICLLLLAFAVVWNIVRSDLFP